MDGKSSISVFFCVVVVMDNKAEIDSYLLNGVVTFLTSLHFQFHVTLQYLLCGHYMFDWLIFCQPPLPLQDSFTLKLLPSRILVGRLHYVMDIVSHICFLLHAKLIWGGCAGHSLFYDLVFIKT